MSMDTELERERMRLAACGVVAMADTPESAQKARDMKEEYRSASCEDVARRVDECMALRAERGTLAAKLAELDGQEPVAWMGFGPRDGRAEFSIKKPAGSVMRDFNMRPVFARPVPAEPVNARLLDVAVWPAGYCRDPNGKMSIPAGKEEDFNFGYDVGFQEAWEILNSAISAEGEEQMTDVTKDLLEALKAAQAYVCGPTAWTQEQEDTLVEAMSKAIARAESALAEPKPDADGWIPWVGGECPVNPNALVRVRFADFLEEGGCRACQYQWHRSNPHAPSDIVAYRVAGESK